MEEKLLWNTPIIKIPDEFVVFTKNNKIKVVKSLTKNNNLKTIKKKKPIKIIEDKNIDNIIIENKGRKVEIDNKDLGLKKMLKEKKPKIKKDIIDQKLIETKNIKKPTIKISEPIITKKEEYKDDEETKKNKEYENKLIKEFNDGLKEYITASKNKYDKYGGIDEKNFKITSDFYKKFIKDINSYGINKDQKIIKNYLKDLGLAGKRGDDKTGFNFLNTNTSFIANNNPFIIDEYKRYLSNFRLSYNYYKKFKDELGDDEKKWKKNTDSYRDYLHWISSLKWKKKELEDFLDKNKNDLYIKNILNTNQDIKDILNNKYNIDYDILLKYKRFNK